MHEICPVREEIIDQKYTPQTVGDETIWYVNDGFKSENTVVGWVDIGTSSRPVTRHVVGRVADSVVLFPDGSEKIKVRTYVRSYKGDYPLSLLGGRVSRSWETEGHEERELTELYSREYASTFAYSHFAADPDILFPGVELPLMGTASQPQQQPEMPQRELVPVPVLAYR